MEKHTELNLITLDPAYHAKQRMRQSLARRQAYTVDASALQVIEACLAAYPFPVIDTLLKRQNLTFDQAYAGTCYILRATNGVFRDQAGHVFPDQDMDFLLAGREFLQSMSVKESWRGLTAEEIAGMVAAASVDLVIRPYREEAILETCGTGGDRGFQNGSGALKLINTSTLSSLVAAAVGIPTMKHGSYKNTSAMGSTDAIEALGAQIDFGSEEELSRQLTHTGYAYTDAHLVKTIHDGSHVRPRHETVNHVIGPMTVPLHASTTLHKVMGVNEKLHPRTVVEAYALLHARGIQRMGNVAVVAGLDALSAPEAALEAGDFYRASVLLDELSPFASVVSFLCAGKPAGTHILTPEHFGISIDPEDILVPNDAQAIHLANTQALRGMDVPKARYLAMNAALCMYVAKWMQDDVSLLTNRGCPDRDLLQLCYRQCEAAIQAGQAWDLLQAYIAETRATPLRADSGAHLSAG